MDKTPQTKLYPIWKELVKIANTWEYGTFHPHEEIADILGLSYTEQYSKYQSNIQKARIRLEELGKQLKCHPAKGYKVTELTEYNEDTLDRVVKSKKHLERAHYIAIHAPVQLMDNVTLIKNDRFLISLTGMKTMADKAYDKLTIVVFGPQNTRFQIKERKPKGDDIE
jgi:biotin operon repressor